MKLSKEKFSRQLKYLKQQRQQPTVSQTELGGIACQQANMQKGKQSDRQGDKLLNEQTNKTHFHHGVQPLFLINKFLGDLTLLQNLSITDGVAFGIEDQLQAKNTHIPNIHENAKTVRRCP